jgi:hypothetical protein
MDYDAYYLKDHQPVTSPDSFQHRGRCHLLLLPSGSAYPPYLRLIQQGDSMETAQAVLDGFVQTHDRKRDSSTSDCAGSSALTRGPV